MRLFERALVDFAKSLLQQYTKRLVDYKSLARERVSFHCSSKVLTIRAPARVRGPSMPNSARHAIAKDLGCDAMRSSSTVNEYEENEVVSNISNRTVILKVK